MSRWQEDCLGHCDDCSINICLYQKKYLPEESFKRSMTLGSVRYGMRVGAVSPPPPGAGGVRYRSKSCWPTSPCGNEVCDKVSVSQIPLLSVTPINSSDIISCANRTRTNTESALQHELLLAQHQRASPSPSPSRSSSSPVFSLKPSSVAVPEHLSLTVPSVSVRDEQFVHAPSPSTVSVVESVPSQCSLLKTHLKRCALVRPQVYSKLVEYAVDKSSTQENIVHDHIHRFHFGGNRGFVSAERRIATEQRYRDFADRFKKHAPTSPVPPPRTRHLRTTPSSTLSTTSVGSNDSNTLNSGITEIQDSLSVTPIPPSEQVDVDLKESSKSEEKVESSDTNIKTTIPTRHTGNTGRGNAIDKKRDKFKRRKGIYFSQWTNNTGPSTGDILPHLLQVENLSEVEYTTKLFQDSLLEISKIRPATTTQSASNNVRNSNSSCQSVSSPNYLKTIPDEFEQFTLSDCDQDVHLNKASQYHQSNYKSSDTADKECSKLSGKVSKDHAQIVADSEMKLLHTVAREDSKRNCNKVTSSNSLTELSVKDDPSSCSSQFPKMFQKQMPQMEPENSKDKIVIRHQHSASSPSKLGVFEHPKDNCASFEQLFRGSSEQLPIMDMSQKLQNDTRTHVVVELYDNERSYVESLEILVTKYLEPLKAPENTNLLEPSLVEEIFYQIPSLLNHHSVFLEELRKRLENWDIKQTIGDLFLEMFSKSVVIDSYTDYVNNWKKAREKIKCAEQSKPAFNRFLEVTARQHLGKLSLDSLLIKPIQKFPQYELLLQRLLKHTDESHPDYCLLLAAQKQVHDQLLKINCSEKETLELEQLREIEGLIDGLIELVTSERQYLRHDLVSMSHGGCPRRERALFLFSDLLLITGIKRRSGTIKKPQSASPASTVTSTLDANKYKLLMKIPLEDIEIRSKDENSRQMVAEVNNISEDISVLNEINELTAALHCTHAHLDEVVKEMLTALNKQLSEQQNNDSQLACLDLTISTLTGLENVSIAFSKPEKRTTWEESLVEAKQKLAISSYRRHFPELLATVPIRKTRAGLQFTCAVPNLADNGRDVWVCNSDGYVGQVCILTLSPEPTVKSCNGVCNARILCICSVPGINNKTVPSNNANVSETGKHKISHFDSSSSSDEDDTYHCEENDESQKYFDVEDSVESEDTDVQQSTMWLGTEDGCIYVYNSEDNIRVKKNKIKLQLGASILCIMYMENRVFVSLSNGNLHVYDRDASGTWNIDSPCFYSVGTLNTPISKMIAGNGKLWCTCGNTIKIINAKNVVIENSFSVSNDVNKLVTCIVFSDHGVWISLQNSGIIKCYHSLTLELLCEVNVAPAVTKMLTSCDDIIRQHKAACLRITALVICKDLLWIGTSAGVILIMPLPHIPQNCSQLTNVPTVSGVPYGHTGHVRLLTCVEMPSAAASVQDSSSRKHQFKAKRDQRNTSKLIVISGGDGYEDFRTSNVSEVAGREDSTNHLLLWNA